MIGGDAYPVRNPRLVLCRDGKQFIARPMDGEAGCRLNETASLLWVWCDGRLTVKQITGSLCQRYPDQTAQVASDVAQALTKLQAQGLIKVIEHPEPARPLVRTAFADFGSDFCREDKYFLRMLTSRFDVVLIDFPQERPDILFCRSRTFDNPDYSRIDRNRTITVLVSTDDQPPDLSQCDYAFSPAFVTGLSAHRHCQVPLWALYLDWEAYGKAESTCGGDRLPDHFKPERVGARFYHDLFESQLSSVEEEALPAPRTPDSRQAAPPLKKEREPGKLTVGMSTYDDFDGVYFTVQAMRLYHREVMDNVEILIIDNHPEGCCAKPLRQLADQIPGCRYIPYSDTRSTFVKGMVFCEARSEYVLCLDSHVMLAPGSLSRLIGFLDANPACRDLLQGPVVYDDLNSISTHFDPVWSGGMYGKWGSDERGKNPDGEPFEIPMQGTGLFACRREAWPGFNPRFQGFGGEEGYLHEKFRQSGRRTLCLPFLRWTHRFSRPFGLSYRNVWEDRIRNYYIGFTELGLDTGKIDEHFSALLGGEAYDRIRSWVSEELSNPFFYFDAIYCINLDTAQDRWQAMQERFDRVGIQHRVRRFSAIKTKESHRIGCALSHRGILEQARKQGLQNVLVFEDDAAFLEETLVHLARSIGELKRQPWKIFHLGGRTGGRRFPKAEGCDHLESPRGELTGTHALAYHNSVYQQLLDALPRTAADMRTWIATHHGMDRYLRNIKERHLASPAVASQMSILPQEDEKHQRGFSI